MVTKAHDQQVSALFDTGATCSCISRTLFDSLTSPNATALTPVKFYPIRIQVNQADGQTSLEPVGLAIITVRLQDHSFTHPFVVCNQLNRAMLLGLDFAGFHKIGFDWTSVSGQVYLRYQGKPIIIGTANAINISNDINRSIHLTTSQSAHSINNVAISVGARILTQEKSDSVNMIAEETESKTDHSVSKPQQERHGVMLQTSKNVRIPPAHISLFYTQPNHNISLDPNRLIEVTANPLTSTEFPMLMVLDTVQQLDPAQLDNNFVVFAYNCGDNDLVIPKHTTIAELISSNLHLKIRTNPRTKGLFSSQIKRRKFNKRNKHYLLRKSKRYFPGLVHKVNTVSGNTKVTMNMMEAEIREVVENSAFLHPSKFYPKPKIILKDAQVSEEIKTKYEDLLSEYEDIMSHKSTDIGVTTLEEVPIETNPDLPPIASKPYTIPLKHQEFVKQELTKLLEAGLITHSISPYASPCLVVSKKSTDPNAELSDQKRLVIDYRALNSQAPQVQTAQAKSKGAIALVHTPNIEQMWSKLKNAKFLSTCDIRSGFHHLILKPEHRYKSAFVVDNYGKFEWLRTPFGLSQAPARFNNLMLKIFFEYMEEFVLFYVDDLLIYSETAEDHLKHIKMVFQKFRESGLKLKLKKCAFFKSQIEYLGHLISSKGISPLPDKIQAITNLKRPNNITQTKHILGLVSYYRQFFPILSETVRPINRITHKSVPHEWTYACENSLKCIQDFITREPMLKYPDPNLPYILYTDSSKYTWSGILMQKQAIDLPDGSKREVEVQITQQSGTYTESQEKWSTIKKEVYAIYASFKKMVFYLRDAKVLIRSDHAPLKKFISANTKNDQLTNWCQELYAITNQITFKHIKGKDNVMSDAISRLERYNLYHPHDSADPKIPIHPEEENLEMSIFDRNVTWRNPQGVSQNEHKVNSVDATSSNPQFELDNQIYEVDLNDVDTIFKESRQLVDLKVTPDELVSLQEKDEQHSKIINDLKKNKVHPVFLLDDSKLLYRRVPDGRNECHAIFVPEDLRPYMLFELHNCFGHSGSTKLYNYMRRFYYWPKMSQDCAKHVRSCEQCQQVNLKPHKFLQLSTAIPQAPMEMIAMDLIQLPLTESGNRYCLTVICLCTHFIFVFTHPRQTN